MGFYSYTKTYADGTKTQFHRYRSYLREKGVPGASSVTVDVPKFEDLVFRFLPEIELEARTDDPRAELISTVDFLESEIEALQAQIKSRSGAGAAVLAPVIADLAEQLETVQQELSLTPQAPTEPTKDYRQKLSRMRRGTIAERKRVRDGIREIVRRITLYPVKLGDHRSSPVRCILEIEFKNDTYVRAVELDDRLIEIAGETTTTLAEQCRKGLRFDAKKYDRIARLAEQQS